MRIRTFRGILDECLECIRRGDTVEACLQRYPRHAERLRPLLSLAARVRTAPPVEPRPWAQATAWDVVRQRAADLRSGKRNRGPSVNFGMWLRPLAIAAAVVMAIMAGGGATALASQSALPDSPLYRVKLATEEVHLWFVFDDSNEASILLDQSDERMDEILAMARKGKLVPSNVLSAMEDRHSRAARSVANLSTSDPDRGELLGRLIEQSESQEDVLLALWDAISPGGREDYTEVVATLHNTRLQGSTDLVLSPQDLSGGVQRIEGEAVRLEDGTWTIGGIKVVIDERTIGGREIEEGATATGIFARNGDRRQALSLISISSPPAFVQGTIEEVTDDGVVIAGQFIPFDAKTILRSELNLGDRVSIEVTSAEEGAVATKVSKAQTASEATISHPLTYVGTIENDVDDSDEWTVSGVSFVVPEDAKIDASAGRAEPNARVLVEASFQDGLLTADSITVLAGETDPDQIFVAGTFEGQRDGDWVISGIPVAPPDRGKEPAAGSLVSADILRVDAALTVNEWILLERPNGDPLVRIQSTIHSLDGNDWDIGYGTVQVNGNTRVSGEPDEGDRVLMWGYENEGGVFQATYVRILDEQNTPPQDD